MDEIDRASLQSAVIALCCEGHLVIREANQLLGLLGYEGSDPFHEVASVMQPVKKSALTRNRKFWKDHGVTRKELREFNAA
jgi:hypothetical protein